MNSNLLVNQTEVHQSSLSHLRKMIILIGEIMDSLEANSTRAYSGEDELYRRNSAFNINPNRPINFQAFIHFLLSNDVFDVSCLIYSLALIDRLVVSGFKITKTNKSLVYYIALIISNKMIQDCSIALKQLAEIVKLQVEDIQAMEYEFLELIKYKTFISESSYLEYLKFVYFSPNNKHISL